MIAVLQEFTIGKGHRHVVNSHGISFTATESLTFDIRVEVRLEPGDDEKKIAEKMLAQAEALSGR